MNAMWGWLTLPLMERFGWALVHFLWQGAAIGALLAAGLALARRASASARYAACCGALALMLAAPVATFVCVRMPSPAAVDAGAASPALAPAAAGPQGGKGDFKGGGRAPDDGSHDVGSVAAAASDAPAPPVPTAPAEPWYRRCADWLDDHLPWLVAGWAVGVLVLSLRLLGGWLLLERIRRSGAADGCGHAQALLDGLRSRMAVRRAVGLAQTALARTPIVVGWLRPIVLMPPCMLTGLSPDELEAVLAHELAHIRRYDYLVNLVQSAAATLLFYHPAVHWVSYRIRVERELCCDEAAVAAVGDAVAYARALARAEDVRRVPALAMGLRRTPLLERVRHVLGAQPAAGRRSVWTTGLSTVVLVLVLTLGLTVYQARVAEAAPLTLHEAAELGDVEALRARLLEGADVNAIDDDGMTPLQRAADAGQAYTARLLIKRGAALEARGSAQSGRTALHMAAGAGQSEVCALLLDAGANVDAREATRMTPLMVAAFADHAETVRLLLERGADVNAGNDWTWTALHFAAQHSCTDAARVLMEHGIVASVKSNQGETAMDRAHDCGSEGIIAMLTPDTAETRAAQQTYGLPGKVLVLHGAQDLRPLRLRIVQAGSREPLPEAGITFDRPMGTLHPDRDGVVLIPVDDARAGSLTLYVGAKGMTPRRLQWAGEPAPKEYTVEMSPGTPIGGLVRDAQGRPVRGAHVTVALLKGLSPWESSSLFQHVERTDVVGRWHCDEAPQQAGTVQVAVAHPDFLAGSPRIHDGQSFERLQTMRDVITLERGYHVKGIVLDDQGRPLVGAGVTIGAEGWRNRNEVGTDAGGRFRSLAQPAGRQVLMAHNLGNAPDLKIVDIGPDLGELEFRLGPGHTIKGRIVGIDGQPLNDAWAVVTAWRGYAPKFYRSPTGPDGRFNWSSAPDEPVGFEFWKTGYVVRENVMLQPSDEEQIITLERRGARPAPGVSVIVPPPGDAKQQLMALVEDFFQHNFRDITSRETIEWGDVQVDAKGNRSIRYKYKATLRSGAVQTMEYVFTFNPKGWFISAETTAPIMRIRTYTVDKTVSEFGPDDEDLSTPEAAYATLNRLSASGDTSSWPRLSESRLRDTFPAGAAARQPVTQSWRTALLGARIVEVQVCEDKFACVIADLADRTIQHPVDMRCLALEDGRWLNAGNDRFDRIDDATLKFAGICAARGFRPTALTPPASDGSQLPTGDAQKRRLMALVEDFFANNFRDISERKAIEWGDVTPDAKGNLSIRYKFEAKSWGNPVTWDLVFTFDPQGKFISADPAGPVPPVRTYAVDKLVSDFPAGEDLSTPEAAYATFNRLSAAGDTTFWARLSEKSLRERLAAGGGEHQPLSDDWKQALLGARIVQVHLCADKFAAVVARLPGATIHQPFDLRCLSLEDSRWLNAGNDRLDTMEEAKAKFARICAMRGLGAAAPAAAPPPAAGSPKAEEKAPPRTFDSALAFDVYAVIVERHQIEHVGSTPSKQALTIPPCRWWYVVPRPPVNLEKVRQEVAAQRIPGLQLRDASDADLAHLEGLTGLQFLDISGKQATDAGLDHLTELTALRMLYVSPGKVTEAGAKQLKKSLPNVMVLPYDGMQ